MEKNKKTNAAGAAGAFSGTNSGAFSGTNTGAAHNGVARHAPMPIELRAKQFMPFAAVTGLEKALREKEKERERTLNT